MDLCGPGRSLIFRPHVDSGTYAAQVVPLFSLCGAGAFFPLRIHCWLHRVTGFCGPGRSLIFRPYVGSGTYEAQVVPLFFGLM